MVERSKPPFRADHVGSLLRPKEITQGFKNFLNGEIVEEEFNLIQDKAIREVIKLQEDVGLKSITDGEFRRASYWSRFVERVDGLEVRDALFTFQNNQGHKQNFTAPHVAEKVKRTQSISGDEFAFVKAHTSETPKITLPSPPSMHLWRLNKGIDPSAYDGVEPFFEDLALVYQEEIAALSENGAAYIQLDDVPLAMLCDANIKNQLESVGMNPAKLLQNYIQLFNSCLANRAPTVSAAIHLCRGNYKGHFLSSGGYEEVAEKMFNELEADAFFLEYDTPRSGDFEPLRHMPKSKTVVIGIVSSKLPELESIDHLCARIDDAAKYIDLEQLALSPQCGFASTVAGNPVTTEIEKAKLARIVEVAKMVWG